VKNYLALFAFFISVQICYGQHDTVTINADMINAKLLKPVENRYLVYFKMGKDSSRTRYQLWTRKIEHLQYEGREAISVTQEWEDNDTVIHRVYSVCEKKSFAPLFQESWWKTIGSSSFDFLHKNAFVQNMPLTEADTSVARKKMLAAFTSAIDQYVLNWHLDLEVFSLLPFRQYTTFLINFYDPGFSAPRLVAYTVTGSGHLTGYDNRQVDCWLLEHTDGNSHEIFWINKKTKEVLKLEQQFGKRFRYKLKLGFSI
jgi:hypothetical protein